MTKCDQKKARDQKYFRDEDASEKNSEKHCSDSEIERPLYDKIKLSQAWSDSFSRDARTFLLRPYIIIPLVSLALFLLILYTENLASSIIKSVKVGLLAAAASLIFIGAIILPDGPFIRPHPVFWKIILSIGIIYQMILTFALCQDKWTVRKILRYIDDPLGQRPVDVYYADNCGLTWENVKPKLDIFVLGHVLGWIGKAIIIRDYNFCWILSVSFEIMEILLEYKFPNFEECWWDRWVLDILITNWLGIYIGMKICKHYAMKKYTWTKIKDIPAFKDKLKRSVQQLTPREWLMFEWPTTNSFSNYIIIIFLGYFSLQCELNVFHLKHILWIPTKHYLVMSRLVFSFFMSLPAVCEIYKYLIDRRCKTLGMNALVATSIIITEALTCYKFSHDEFTVAAPVTTKVGAFLVALIIFTFGFVKFGLPQFQSRFKVSGSFATVSPGQKVPAKKIE